MAEDQAAAAATQVYVENIRDNCVTHAISLSNVCWGTYVDATVARTSYNLFGAAQKGFMVKDYATGKKYVWSGTQWAELSV